MEWWQRLACHSVGKKILLALSGFGLVGFVVVHMLGNLQAYVGSDAFNKYGHLITSNPLFPILEPALLGMFLFHALLAIILVKKNKDARPMNYETVRTIGGKSRRTFASTYMPVSGVLLLVFIVVHVVTMRFGTWYETHVGGEPMRDLYRLMQEQFQQPVWAGFYVISMVFLFSHLSHGISSMFQSVGGAALSKKMIVPAKVIAFVVAAGFASIPLWMFFGGGQQ